MNILITGGAGFIGSQLCEYLSNLMDNKFVILDNLSTGRMGNINLLTGKKNVTFINADIRNLVDLNDIFTEYQFAAVIHLAAVTSVERSFREPRKTLGTNVMGFMNVAGMVEKHGVTRFIYASSSSVYGGSSSKKIPEDLPLKPLSLYAKTKELNEFIAHQIISGSCVTGLRFFNVYGENQRSDSKYSAVIPLFIEAIRKDQQITIHGSGKQIRDFTHVSNVCDAIHKILNAPEIRVDGKIFNVGTGSGITIRKLADKIAQIMGKDLKNIGINYVEKRSGDVMKSCADISEIKDAVGFKVITDLDSGLGKIIKG